MPVFLAAFVPGLVAFLVNGLRILFMTRIGLWIGTALVWLGISWGTMNMVLEPALDQLRNFSQGGGSTGQFIDVAKQWAGVLNFDKALTMVIGAFVTKKAVGAARLFLMKRGTP